MVRTNSRGDPVRLTLELIGRENGYRVIRALLMPEGGSDLAERAGLPKPRVSEVLQAMRSIGVVENDGDAYRLVDPDACWEILRGAARIRRVQVAADQASLDELEEQFERWRGQD